ncbi:YpfB family protein [Neobacillus sp. YIM B06451]|uniref:YpfB family protein n=1 Tax=Neobacillus sp. YIM B06451 TaxID=3070994 RepID=UPI00292DE353|nr:YpfB family protein [Neobacillus sp. YIM B06451]
MKFAERILIKAAVAQFIFLLIAQIFIHRFGILPELKTITQYEGTGKMNHSDMLEVFREK